VLKALFQSMRPKQWAKNVFIFVPLLFDEKLLQPAPFLRAVAAAALFCLISSAVYLLNDLGDVEQDKLHPVKRLRPLAAGRLPKKVATAVAIALPLISIPLSWLLSPTFAVIVVIYFLQNVAYTFWLKHVVILDVMTIAAGYLLRVAGGAAAVHVARFSPWLYIFTTFLALFIALNKRRHELTLLQENANEHRAILQEYNVRFVDEMTSIVAACTIMAYSLYTFSSPNLPANNTMMLTIPPLIYGVLRYLYLVHVKEMGGEPEEIFLKDIPLIATCLLYGGIVFLVMYLQ